VAGRHAQVEEYARHDSNLYRLVPGGFRTTLIWILSPLALFLGVWLRERRDSWAVLHLCTPVTNLYSAAVLAEWIGPLEMLLSWAALLAVGNEVHHGAPTFVIALAILARRRASPDQAGPSDRLPPWTSPSRPESAT
jgi:hypothetical protein